MVEPESIADITTFIVSFLVQRVCDKKCGSLKKSTIFFIRVLIFYIFLMAEMTVSTSVTLSLGTTTVSKCTMKELYLQKHTPFSFV